jgi:hypothetical protein
MTPQAPFPFNVFAKLLMTNCRQWMSAQPTETAVFAPFTFLSPDAPSCRSRKDGWLTWTMAHHHLCGLPHAFMPSLSHSVVLVQPAKQRHSPHSPHTHTDSTMRRDAAASDAASDHYAVQRSPLAANRVQHRMQCAASPCNSRFVGVCVALPFLNNLSGVSRLQNCNCPIQVQMLA